MSTPSNVISNGNDVQTEQDREEQLILEQTKRMREKLKKSRIIKKFDESMSDWLKERKLDCLSGSFCKALLAQNILKLNEFLRLSEDYLRRLIDSECDDLSNEQIERLMKEWNASKIECEQSKKIKRRKGTKEKKEKKIKKERVRKFVCDKNVRRFLSDFGLLEVEHIFGREGFDMTQLAQINSVWIRQRIVGESEYANNLRMRLKLSIRALRREIAEEFAKKIKKNADEQAKQNKMRKKSNSMRKNLKKIHPILLKVHDAFSDPLYLLSFGFVIFIIFTFVLFVVIGPETN